MNKQKYDKTQVWEDIINEYQKNHQSGGLTWWAAPLEEQPIEFKIEMYDIFWTFLNNKDSK